MPVDAAGATTTRSRRLPRGPCRHSVSSARAARPGCSIGRPRQAGLLACGSVLASPSRISDPVAFDAWHTAYSCGGSPGFYPSSRFNPPKGNLARGEKVPQPKRRVNRHLRICPCPLRTVHPRRATLLSAGAPPIPSESKSRVAKKDLQRCRTRTAGRLEKSAQVEPACASDMGGHHAARTQRVDLLDRVG
jgi:hypothetical protein